MRWARARSTDQPGRELFLRFEFEALSASWAGLLTPEELRDAREHAVVVAAAIHRREAA